MAVRYCHAIWPYGVRVEHPGSSFKHIHGFGWQNLVIMDRRIYLPRVGCLWLLGGICEENPVAKPATMAGIHPLHLIVFDHSYVLLVAAGSYRPFAVGWIFSFIYRQHCLERYISQKGSKVTPDFFSC